MRIKKKDKEKHQNHANWLFAYHHMEIKYFLQCQSTIRLQTVWCSASCICSNSLSEEMTESHGEYCASVSEGLHVSWLSIV